MKVFLIMPSRVMARGIEGVFHDLGEFQVEGIVPDLSPREETMLKNLSADAIIVDPAVFAHSSQSNARQYISAYTDAAIVAFSSIILGDEAARQYDAVLNLYDSPADIIHKLRSAVSSPREHEPSGKEELSAREKDILICVAKGLINKEIADLFNISIHTVITHRRNIAKKLQIHSSAGLAIYAIANKIVELQDIKDEIN